MKIICIVCALAWTATLAAQTLELRLQVPPVFTSPGQPEHAIVRSDGAIIVSGQFATAFQGTSLVSGKNLQVSCNLSSAIEQYEVNAETITSQIKNYEYKTSSQSLEAGADRRLAGAAVDNAGGAATNQ